MLRHLYDPTYLRERARQTRAAADLMSEGTERERLRRTAGHYELLADRADVRVAEPKDAD